MLMLAALLQAGCQSLAPKAQSAAAPEVQQRPLPALPFEEPEPVAQELDEDLVFSYLVGEIGARSGELEAALTHYLHAAMLGRDAYAAERATRIAIHLKDFERGRRAAHRWVELAPNSLAARQLSALLLLRSGQPELAREQFDAVMRIADALGKDGMLQVAAALNSEDDNADAVQVMQALVAERAGDARAHYALAVVETAQQRYAEAESSLREAIRLKPDWAQPRVLLSRVLVALGRTEQGLRHLAGAIEDYPDDKALRISYARLLVSEALYDDALAQFQALYKLAPEDREVRYGYAMLATQQRQWDEARALWQVLRNDSHYREEATYFLAQVEESEGNDSLAIGLYRAVGSGELKTDAAIRMAGLMARAGQVEQAREVLSQARIAHAERSIDLYLAETQLLQSADADRDQIESLYAVAIGAHPEDLDLPYNRGLYYAEIGEQALMEQDFQSVLTRDPDNAEALNALGYTLADANRRLDEAYRYIRRALELKPGNRAILDSLGWVYYRMGDYASSLRYLRSANEGEPDDEIAAHLGEVLWVSGETDEARQVWVDALRDSPQSEELRAVMDRFLGQ